MLTLGAPAVDVRSSPDRGYRPALDGLRAVAVTAVVGYHLGYGWLPGGFLGVDLFFVLSGYLITGLLLDEHGRTGRIGLARFWARRARRLLPALLIMLVAVAAAVRLWSPPGVWLGRRDDLVATLFYYANWHFVATDQSYFADAAAQSPVRHAWSLSIEEQFYLVWPFLILLALRRRRRFLAVGLAVATVASAVLMVAVYDPVSPTRAYVGTDARVQQLVAGALLALVIRTALVVPGRLVRYAGRPAAAGTVALLLTVRDSGGLYYHGGASLAAFVFAALVWALETRPSSAVARALSTRPLRAVGTVSYGLYLWHWPVLLFFPHRP